MKLNKQTYKKVTKKALLKMDSQINHNIMNKYFKKNINLIYIMIMKIIKTYLHQLN